MISYIGGKARIGKWITPQIPNDIETYVEGFSGMFWVFFNMDLEKYPNLKTVVYNDFNKLNHNLMYWTKQYDVLHEALSHYPCQQLGVVDTPPEYAQMFSDYQREIFDDNLQDKMFEYLVTHKPGRENLSNYLNGCYLNMGENLAGVDKKVGVLVSSNDYININQKKSPEA